MPEAPAAATIMRQPHPVTAIRHAGNHQTKIPFFRESFTQLQ
ncbi:hypothetical protein [Burkholderia sp. Bp8998]|nr:hypothetical protein [Burkholderia sp. Bp8998]